MELEMNAEMSIDFIELLVKNEQTVYMTATENKKEKIKCNLVAFDRERKCVSVYTENEERRWFYLYEIDKISLRNKEVL